MEQAAFNFDDRPAQRRERIKRTLNASELRFNGSDYDRQRDDARLSGQALRIFELMQDGVWRTLEQIASATNDPPASVSAQLRHLRKSRFGGHTVNKRHLGNGLYEYQVCPAHRHIP